MRSKGVSTRKFLAPHLLSTVLPLLISHSNGIAPQLITYSTQKYLVHYHSSTLLIHIMLPLFVHLFCSATNYAPSKESSKWRCQGLSHTFNVLMPLPTVTIRLLPKIWILSNYSIPSKEASSQFFRFGFDWCRCSTDWYCWFRCILIQLCQWS